jgi:hypothetical protein
VGNEGLTSAMTSPLSNIVFDMAAATLSNGNLRGVILNVECAGSQEVIEISLKPSWLLQQIV